MAMKNVRLIALRQEADWTQKELAEKVGLSQSMIAHIEGGKKDPSRKYRMQLAKLFGVSVEWLFYEQVEDEPEQIKTRKSNAEKGVVADVEERIPAHS